jgi:hypothetical protein
MPNQIIWEEKGVISHYRGLFSPELHVEGLGKLFGDSRIDDINYIIGDYLEVSRVLLTAVNIDYPVAMTTGASSYLKDIKVALVATDQKIIKLCEHFIKLSSQVNPTWETRLFGGIQSARDWVTADL